MLPLMRLLKMAEPIAWHGANKVLNPPKGNDYISTINVFNNGTASVSCWRLTPEELIEATQNGGLVFVAVLSGPSQTPMFVGSEEAVREVVIDTGPVWNKNKSMDEGKIGK